MLKYPSIEDPQGILFLFPVGDDLVIDERSKHLGLRERGEEWEVSLRLVW